MSAGGSIFRLGDNMSEEPVVGLYPSEPPTGVLKAAGNSELVVDGVLGPVYTRLLA
jgi:hypothetical protein